MIGECFQVMGSYFMVKYSKTGFAWRITLFSLSIYISPRIALLGVWAFHPTVFRQLTLRTWSFCEVQPFSQMPDSQSIRPFQVMYINDERVLVPDRLVVVLMDMM